MNISLEAMKEKRIYTHIMQNDLKKESKNLET